MIVEIWKFLSGLDPLVAGLIVFVAISIYAIKVVASGMIKYARPYLNLQEEARQIYIDSLEELKVLKSDLQTCAENLRKLEKENRKLTFKIDIIIHELYRWTNDYPPRKEHIEILYKLIQNEKKQ